MGQQVRPPTFSLNSNQSAAILYNAGIAHLDGIPMPVKPPNRGCSPAVECRTFARRKE